MNRPPARAGWLARAGWWAGLGLVALVACFAQLDRQSRYTPELAVQVPPPLRAFSQYHLAATALRSGSADQALEETRRLVARRPIPSDHIALLAAEQIQSGDYARGALTIQQAARRGWRNLAAQHAMLQLALAAGDHDEAAARLAALLVLAQSETELAPLARDALDSPQMRAALARIIAANPRWRDSAWARLERILPAPALSDIGEHIGRSAAQRAGEPDSSR